MSVNNKIKELVSSMVDHELDISTHQQAVTFRLNPDDYSEFIFLTEETGQTKAALAKMMCREALKDATKAYIEQMGDDYSANEREFKSMVAETKHELFPKEPKYKDSQKQTELFKRQARTA
jgi:predicted DNA-binding protein